MKAISIQQPYGTLIAIQAKAIETRSWSTKYRGPLAIHTSKVLKPALRDLCLQEPFSGVLAKGGYVSVEDLPLGMVIATCNLVDVWPITPDNIPSEPEYSFGDYTPGRFSWSLKDVKRLPKPIAAKGQLGLWDF